jgi:hypothetical protein
MFTLVARAPLTARIEGALDHDQSVVGLMALDIAAGRRFPIFFDGQRYMGAVEAYLAALFVRAFGHAPSVVALAPLLAFGLFVAGQYAVWRIWANRATADLAAGLSVLCAPLLSLWGIVPRGGYVEFLAWALPVLALYRRLARRSRSVLAAPGQAAWGFVFGLGYFLNPLSLTVYATICFDWVLGRHGVDLRRERLDRASWLDRAHAPLVWLGVVASWIVGLAVFCHVDSRDTSSDTPYVVLCGLLRGPGALAIGAAGVLIMLGVAAGWTSGLARLSRCLRREPWALLGLVLAAAPFLAQNALVRFGMIAPAPSLPVWIGAPWKAGENLSVAARALGTILGCRPDAVESVVIGQGVDPPAPSWQSVVAFLGMLSPVVVTAALVLIGVVAWQERGSFSKLFALRRDDAATPAALLLSFLVLTTALFLLQGTSPNASSVRYLVPLWAALPGVLATGLLAIPRRAGIVAGLVLLVPWCAAQVCLWRDLDRSSSARPLARELQRRGIPAIVAPTPVALIVANLSHGSVGAVEYQPIWPRLGGRYLDRFPANSALTCVVDHRFPWAIHGEGAWAPQQDLCGHLARLADRYPGRVRPVWEIGQFEVWQADVPLSVILAEEPEVAVGRDLKKGAKLTRPTHRPSRPTAREDKPHL